MTSRNGPDVEILITESQAARTKQVKADIARRGKRFEAGAKARHAAHRDRGHSRVGGFQGRVDYNIYLDDARGDHAAISIEFGTHRMLGTHTLTGTPIWLAGGDSSV